MRSCINSNVAPTIYTIEDHAGESPLINLAPSSIVPDGNSGGENDITPSIKPAQQKKRKLSVTECFPLGGNAIGATAASTRVKQEPRNTDFIFFFYLSFKLYIYKQTFINCVTVLSNTGQSTAMSPRQISATGSDEDYSYEFSADSSMFNDSYQCIRFQAFQQNSWHSLFDVNFKELYCLLLTYLH